ncbi:MAG: heme A synthase [Gemmatimonadales bacterium]
MRLLKPLAVTTAASAFALVALSPLVRITDSGLGCGEHWPLCNGHLIPPLDNVEVMIEWGHRLAAAAVSTLLLVMTGYAFLFRHTVRIAGKQGVLKLAILGCILLVVQILLGAITVWNSLPWAVTATHLANAMVLLAVLSVAAFRALELPQTSQGNRHHLFRAAVASVALGASALLLGAITANTGAGPACQGFPLCSGQIWPTAASSALPTVHWIHRLVAYGLFFHMLGLTIRVERQPTPAVVRTATRLTFGLTVLQIAVAVVMVLASLPTVWRSLHAVIATALWVALIHLAWTTATIDPQTSSA